MSLGVRRVHGVSRITGLPRFVVRIRAGGRTYHYFRHGPARIRLPDPESPEFPGSYAIALTQHALCVAARGKPPTGARRESQVYFIQDKHSGAIKIGTARFPKQRLREIQVGAAAQLKLLASVPGGRGLERELHARLEPYRIRGEWFLNAPEVREAMRELRA